MIQRYRCRRQHLPGHLEIVGVRAERKRARAVDLAARVSAAGDEENPDPTCREQSGDDLPHQTPDPEPSITVLDLSTATLRPLSAPEDVPALLTEPSVGDRPL